MSKKLRSNLAYINENEILERISKGVINVHDVVYTKDTHVIYIISPDLVPIEIKARVYAFDSVAEAETALNAATDTYIGQIVSILYGEAYTAYIVNKNYKNEYYVTPLSSDNGQVDYNTLGNRPIINLVGTLDEPILIEALENGIYSVKGQYKISNQFETIYLSATNNLFVVEKTTNVVYIKKITSTEIIDYTITSEYIQTSQIATTAYIESCGYATTSYVDEKIASLDCITQEQVDTYVKELVIEIIDELLDERIDVKLDEKLQESDDSQILALFMQN